MADIHILETPKHKGRQEVTAIFHVPVDRTNNSYPGGQTSQVPGISQTEIDALAAGTLYELSKQYKFPIGTSAATMSAQVRGDWEPVRQKVQAAADTRYQYYGVTLERA